MLCLKPAGHGDREKEYAFVRDMPVDENGFTNEFYGLSLADFLNIALPQMIAWSRGEQLPPGFVPETFFFLWDDDVIVGQFRLRHYLTDALREGAGHIGYFIAPPFRGRGYATRGLALTLGRAARIVPEDEIYLRVNRDNPASLRVMCKNGGVIHHQDEHKTYVRIAKNVHS